MRLHSSWTMTSSVPNYSLTTVSNNLYYMCNFDFKQALTWRHLKGVLLASEWVATSALLPSQSIFQVLFGYSWKSCYILERFSFLKIVLGKYIIKEKNLNTVLETMILVNPPKLSWKAMCFYRNPSSLLTWKIIMDLV
jgi:hypothetical protein